MELTKDDERARRICSIALEFMNAQAPLSSSDVAQTFYPGLSSDSFRKAFSRDREALFACGVSIEEVRRAGEESLWRVDEEGTFVSGADLGALDAAALEIACQPLLEDGSFPLAEDLRMALAKISSAFAETPAHHGPAPVTTRRMTRQHATLLSCVLSSSAAQISYVDARGSESSRLVAPFAFFELWGTLYLVAGRLDEEGHIMEGGTRTYRLDRVTTAKPLPKTRFQVPEDFSVLDWRRLPFQMGATQLTGTFEVPCSREADVRAAALGQGSFQKSDGLLTWEVPIADVSAAASWAIAQGIRPLAPAPLTEAWRAVLEGVLAHA